MFSVKLCFFSFSADGRVSRKGACSASLHIGCQPKWSPQPEAISEYSRKHSGFNSQTPLQQVCPGRSTDCQMPPSFRYQKQFLRSINTPWLSVRMTKPVSISPLPDIVQKTRGSYSRYAPNRTSCKFSPLVGWFPTPTLKVQTAPSFEMLVSSS